MRMTFFFGSQEWTFAMRLDLYSFVPWLREEMRPPRFCQEASRRMRGPEGKWAVLKSRRKG